MKIFNYTIMLRFLSVCLLPITLYSCGMGGGMGPAPRKKMPAFNSSDGIEGGSYGSYSTRESQSSFAFLPTNVDVTFNGATKGFVSIQLPNSVNDSAAVSLVNSLKPFALPLIASWALQPRNGVLIDLSNHQTQMSVVPIMLCKVEIVIQSQSSFYGIKYRPIESQSLKILSMKRKASNLITCQEIVLTK